MPEENVKNIRVPVPKEVGKHTGHKIRTVVISVDDGIKALYCVQDKVMITYIFAKSKGWTMTAAKKWVTAHTKTIKELKEICVDQEEEFLKLICTYTDDEVEEWIPNSPSFELTKEIEDETMGVEKKDPKKDGKQEEEKLCVCPKCQHEQSKSADKACSATGCEECGAKMEDKSKKARGDGQGTGGSRQGDGGASVCVCPKCGNQQTHTKGVPCNQIKCKECGASMVGKMQKSEESIELVKIDKMKQIVYGIFLVPDKADHDGDVIDAEDIEKVAHGFLVEYRDIDEMHKNIIAAEIVESAIAWADDFDFYGKKLTKGTWFGAIKINDRDVWNKVLEGKYKAFSVRIAGTREPINE